MAYVNAGTRANSAGATSRVPALPGSRVNGNLLIAVVGSKNNATHSISGSGWTQIGSQVNSGANWTVSIWKRVVDGTEAAPTISWTGSVACFGQVIQFNATAASPIGAVLSNNGTTATHSNSGVTTTAVNSLVIYIDAAAANTAIAQPSGWTERLDGGSTTGATRNANGDKTVAASGAASGSISVTGANAAWVMWQIELLALVVDLTVADGTHAHSSDNLTIEEVAGTLTVADGTHAQTTDAVTLEQVHSLTVAEGTHGQAAESVTLEQVYILTVADGGHALTTYAVTLTQVHSLTAGDGMHAQTADGVTLEVYHVLMVDDGSHAQAVDAITLEVYSLLAVEDGAHVQRAESVIVSRTYGETFAVLERDISLVVKPRETAFDVPRRDISFDVR